LFSFVSFFFEQRRRWQTVTKKKTETSKEEDEQEQGLNDICQSPDQHARRHKAATSHSPLFARPDALKFVFNL